MNQIFIIGFMGSGKSTVAGALAHLLNCEMVDLDEVIQSREGRSAAQIIQTEGETSFREIEARTLEEVTRETIARVVALGGGAWIAEANRQMISERGGTSVWLDAPFKLCWERISASGVLRPLARGETDAQCLFAERRSCYELANLRVPISEQQSPDQIAAEIIEALSTRR